MCVAKESNLPGKNIRRGDIFWAEMPNKDQQLCLLMGTRPVLVISNDQNNEHSRNITVVPFSSKIWKKGPRYPFHVFVQDVLRRDSIVLAEQIFVLPKEHILGSPIAFMPQEYMSQVDAALKCQLALS